MRSLNNQGDGDLWLLIVIVMSFFIIILPATSIDDSGSSATPATTTSPSGAPVPEEHAVEPPQSPVPTPVMTFGPIPAGGNLWEVVASYAVAHGAVDYDTAIEATAETIQALRLAYPDRDLDEVYEGETFTVSL